MHTTRNAFKKENFNMKNTEIAFYFFKQYLSIGIYTVIYRCTLRVMEIHLKYFVFFSCSWRIKLLNNLKNQSFHCIKYARIRVFSDRILPYKDKIYDFIYIRKNTGHWKPVFSHILCSVSWQFQAKFHMLGYMLCTLTSEETMTMIMMTDNPATKITISDLQIGIIKLGKTLKKMGNVLAKIVKKSIFSKMKLAGLLMKKRTSFPSKIFHVF